MKNILNKGTLIGFSIGLLTTIDIVFAAQNITTLTQTATTGDKITAEWVNAVNAKLSSGNPASAAGGDVSCVNPGGSLLICVWSDGTCKGGNPGNDTTSQWWNCDNALQ